MKRSRAKDEQQQARGRLRASPKYAEARTRLAIEQAARVAQLRERDGRDLIPAAEMRNFFTFVAQTLCVQFLGVEARVRAAHPQIDAAILATIASEHRRALTGLHNAVKRMAAGNGAANE